MENDLRRGITGLCAALVCALFPWTLSGEEFIRKPAAEAYSDPGTGMAFPARIDSFEKVMVRVNPSPLYGTDIAYENETGSFADVYIYRLSGNSDTVTPEQFKAHFSATVDKILKMPGRTSLIRRVELARPVVETLPSEVSAAHFRINAEKDVFLSSLYLFRKKEYMVKIRITHSDGTDTDKQSADCFLRAVLNLAGLLSKQ